MLKYLISDMDHTLLHNDGQLDQQTINVVKASSINLCLASARNPHSMVSFIDQLGLTGPQLAMNGSLIFQLNRGKLQILHEQPIETQLAVEIKNTLQQIAPNVDFTWITSDHWYIPQMTPAMREEMKYSGVHPVIGKQLEETTAPDQIVLIIQDVKEFNLVKNHLQRRFADLTIHCSGDGYLTINAAGVNKGNLVEYLISQGNERGQIAGVGDDENDLPLLKAAGHAIAVANAVPQVKQVAERLIASNQNNGIARFLQQFKD
ncbi:HAD family hydrolase [uncultured Limosilactobacillus sp.]|uniref:HAD family hydrolase n=1 Tax=uncultured Limosilactobacillus sp. TaxID=2837629 RepID=UPI0025EC71D9|nr:HAD family hydrolase [uncultured Limosilactobacillus sp.]